MWNSYLQLSFAMIMAGSSFIAAKQLTTIPPITVSALSFLTALIPFATYTLIKEGFQKVDKTNLKYIFLQAFFGAFLVRLIINVGVNYTSALEAGIILSIVPAITLILSKILLKEDLRKKQVIGITLVLIGTIIINIRGKNSDNQNLSNIFGNLLLITGVICSSLFTIFSKKIDAKISLYSHTSYVLLFATLLYVPLMLIPSFTIAIPTIEMKEWLYILYYGFIATAFSYFLWFKGLTKVKANLASVFMGIMPVSSTVLSLIILREKLNIQTFLGLSLILIGIVNATLNRKSS